MIDNKDYNKLIGMKYFFIGFIVGIIPFIIILEIMAYHEGGINYIPSLFKNTLIFFAIFVSIANAFILKNMVKNIK